MKILFLTVIFISQLLAAYAANIPLMPVRDLKAGMAGTGRTVVYGDTIEEFDVEILGVTGSEAAGYNILVRLYGDLIESTGGVAQGMSGSPVFVDGRLVGAVAFGRAFNDPHYCFLTPIGKMLRLLDEGSEKENSWLPVSGPLMAGGFSGEGLSFLNEKLAPFGLSAVDAGGSGGPGTLASGPLVPGSSVAVSLMQGDLTLGALGTVTWTDDEGHLLAFGHPFMQRGDSNFYMNKVWVLGIVPNLQSGYKVATLGEAVGRFSQDRASGVGGKLGTLPDAIPLFIEVQDLDRSSTKNLSLSVIDDDQLLGTIVEAAVVNAVSLAADRGGGGTARLAFTVAGENSAGETLRIQRDNMYYASAGISKIMSAELLEALNILSKNKFEAIKLKNIKVEASLSEPPQVVEVVSAGVRSRKVKPGEKVDIQVKLKPYRGKEFARNIFFTVPKNHSGGRLHLNVRGGASMAWAVKLLRKQQQEGEDVQPKQDKRRNLGDFIKAFNEADKNNELIVDIAAGAGTALKETPEAETQGGAGLMGLLAGTPNKTKEACDFIIDGECDIYLVVEKPEEERDAEK